MGRTEDAAEWATLTHCGVAPWPSDPVVYRDVVDMLRFRADGRGIKVAQTAKALAAHFRVQLRRRRGPDVAGRRYRAKRRNVRAEERVAAVMDGGAIRTNFTSGR